MSAAKTSAETTRLSKSGLSWHVTRVASGNSSATTPLLANRAARERSHARNLSHAKAQVVLESQARNTQAPWARSCLPQVLLHHASPPSRSWQQMLFHRSTSVMQVRLKQAAISCHWHPLGQTYSSNHLMVTYSTSQTVIAPSRLSTASVLTQTQWEV